MLTVACACQDHRRDNDPDAVDDYDAAMGGSADDVARSGRMRSYKSDAYRFGALAWLLSDS